MVLFGTATLFQPNCRTALPNAPGIPQFGSGYNQRAAGCGSAIGVRSRRCGFTSARISLLVFVALRVQRSWVSGLEIGYPRARRALCGNLRTLKRSKASETARLLPSCSAVVFDGG